MCEKGSREEGDEIQEGNTRVCNRDVAEAVADQPECDPRRRATTHEAREQPGSD